MPIGANRAEYGRFVAEQGGGQWVVRVGDRPREELDIVNGYAVAADADQRARLGHDRQTHRSPHAGVPREPFKARLDTPAEVVVVDKVVLEEPESGGRGRV